MGALMIGLLAGALVSFGGRWWLLGRAIGETRGQAVALPALLLSAIIVAVVAAYAGGTMAQSVRGPGLLLFLALSLLFAGAGALWPMRPIKLRLVNSARGPTTAFILLMAAQLSESAPFIILAAAAWSLDPLSAGIGGGVGMVAAALSTSLLSAEELAKLPMRHIRRGIGVLLLSIGLWLAPAALGLA